ncbi:MAG: hypothetical protein K2H71_00795, partial [Muribaculaceae bacterium]|nr:hypothetical protein [Muribaculaceae bacterium]
YFPIFSIGYDCIFSNANLTLSPHSTKYFLYFFTHPPRRFHLASTVSGRPTRTWALTVKNSKFKIRNSKIKIIFTIFASAFRSGCAEWRNLAACDH